jgi:hypothetical protein
LDWLENAGYMVLIEALLQHGSKQVSEMESDIEEPVGVKLVERVHAFCTHKTKLVYQVEEWHVGLAFIVYLVPRYHSLSECCNVLFFLIRLVEEGLPRLQHSL